MKLTVVGLGGKHELEVKAADTLAAVKAQLAPLVSLPPEELKLVAKGKAPPDATPLSALGLADGGKLMLMRSQAGAKSLQQRGKAAAPASATSANSRPLGAPPWLSIGCEVDYLDSGGERHSAVVQAIHTDDPPQLYCTVALAGGGERQTPLDRVQPRGGGGGAGGGGVGGRGAVTAAGEGPVLLSVSQGASKFELRCEPHSTVLSLKALLAPLVSGGAEPAAMRLLAKGKEAADDATVAALGMAPAGGRLMLLFKRRHHAEREGVALVQDGVARLAELRERVGKLTSRLRKRLLDAAEAQVQLGALEEELNAISLDLKNAAPNETSDAAAVRRERLAECARVGDELSAARKEHADALLGAQLGR